MPCSAVPLGPCASKISFRSVPFASSKMSMVVLTSRMVYTTSMKHVTLIRHASPKAPLLPSNNGPTVLLPNDTCRALDWCCIGRCDLKTGKGAGRLSLSENLSYAVRRHSLRASRSCVIARRLYVQGSTPSTPHSQDAAATLTEVRCNLIAGHHRQASLRPCCNMYDGNRMPELPRR